MLRDARSDAHARGAAQPLAARDYHEVVTYSFVDAAGKRTSAGNAHPVALANPIASQMSVMRSSLIPGLVDSVAFNVRHKQTRVRVFEIGRCFRERGRRLRAAGARRRRSRTATRCREQWGAPARARRLLRRQRRPRSAVRAARAALRSRRAPGAASGQVGADRHRHADRSAGSASCIRGWQQKYELPLRAGRCSSSTTTRSRRPRVPAYREIAKFPPVRRDMAALFDENVPHQAILEALKAGRAGDRDRRSSCSMCTAERTSRKGKKVLHSVCYCRILERL